MAESMQGLKRTHRCGELSAANVGETATIMGWVQKNRNKGGLVFVDVRDRSGIIQVVFDEGSVDAALIEKAAKLRSEYVVAVVGKVAKRSGAVNENIATGEIEIIPEELRVLSESETPPFQIEENSKTKEEVRLKYRYLDLRRPDMQRNLMMRSKVATLARQFMANEGFLEIETPVLIGSTPEGARDYLVPSRVHQGHFYALPQSPQLFKQLLMCSGYDRYFQIAKCFRDEDLRADRQPEFTQMDMELSFVDVDDVIDVNERFLAMLFKEVLGVEVPLPIPRMTWQEAMDAAKAVGKRLPTWQELKALCDLGSTWDDELKGRWFGGNHNSDHKGSLFLPAAGLRDSKKLSEEAREALAPLIKERALDWSVAHATVEEIDELNILQATMLAMKRAVMGLTVRPNLVLVDGNRVPHIDIAVNAIVGGDDKVAAISAASIIAKTTRDQWLVELDKEHPEYGFAKHKGYGTPEHLAALEKYGPLPAHRKTFAPVKKVIEMRKGKEGELELT